MVGVIEAIVPDVLSRTDVRNLAVKIVHFICCIVAFHLLYEFSLMDRSILYSWSFFTFWIVVDTL